MSGEWTDRIAGARMQVDQQFQERVQASQFSNQQWGLVMTAVEFDIEDAETPDSAELVARTDRVEQILPELDNLPQGMSGGPARRNADTSGGLLGRVRGLFGDSESEDVDEERLTEATELVAAYADTLQSFLEEQGRWEEACQAASRAE